MMESGSVHSFLKAASTITGKLATTWSIKKDHRRPAAGDEKLSNRQKLIKKEELIASFTAPGTVSTASRRLSLMVIVTICEDTFYILDLDGLDLY